MFNKFTKSTSSINWWLLSAFSCILLGFILLLTLQYYYFATFSLSDINTQGKLGPISDWLSGSLTPFIALASFILLYRTYQNQKEELRLTRMLMHQQKFETTFFNTLSFFNDQARSINYRIRSASGLSEYCGQEYFKQMHFKVFESMCNSKGTKDPNLLISLEQHIRSYVEVLHCLLLSIDTTQEIDKSGFVRLLKATMSAEAKYVVHYFVDNNPVEEYNCIEKLITKYDVCDMVQKAEFARRFNEKFSCN